MAYNFNGFGTKLYGCRDFRSDGSYLTTEWIVLFFVPVIPIRSIRLIYQGPGSNNWNVGFASSSSERYLVYQRTFPHWKQVLFTYGYLALLAGWCYTVFRIALYTYPHILDSAWALWAAVMISLLPLPTPWILRNYAQKKARQ